MCPLPLRSDTPQPSTAGPSATDSPSLPPPRPKKRRWDDSAPAPAPALPSKAELSTPTPPTPSSLTLSLDQAKQALLYKQQIADKLAKLNIPVTLPTPLPAPPESRQWTPLHLDEQGRQVDASGAVVTVKREAELRVNQQREEGKDDRRRKEKRGKPVKVEEAPPPLPNYFDPALSATQRDRAPRALRFTPVGLHEKRAAAMRAKLLEQAMQETEATEGEEGKGKEGEVTEGGSKEEVKEEPQVFVVPTHYDVVPDMEPWDVALCAPSSFQLLPSKLTSLIYHPTPILSLTPAPPPPPHALVLTMRERKKLKRRAALDKAKEQTEKIRLGLIPPPPPKLRLSNLMNSLINDSVAEPSELERRVREEMRLRVEGHERANAERKLSVEGKKEKAKRKMKEKALDAAIHVHVYAVRRGLGVGRVRYLLDVNTMQWNLTGVGVFIRQSEAGGGGGGHSGDDERNGLSVVVVEGGPKGLRRFQRLMLVRIDWKKEVERAKAEGGGGSSEMEGMSEDDSEDEDEGVEHRNTRECALVWQGVVAKAAFLRFGFEVCRSEAQARAVFSQLGVVHYFDIARQTNLDTQETEG